jgi:hypothetical protein
MLAGCAAQSQSKPVAQAAAISSTRDLAGVWVEYWAPTGKADSQRFVFLPDGRFAWQAALSGQPPAAGPARKAGHFQVERTGHDASLVLSVSSDEQRACAPCADGDTAVRRVDYAPERLERYELGECAPNVEAQALDASYACLSIAGRAFWRQSASQADAAALLWPQAATP